MTWFYADCGGCLGAGVPLNGAGSYEAQAEFSRHQQALYNQAKREHNVGKAINGGDIIDAEYTVVEDPKQIEGPSLPVKDREPQP